MIYLISRHSGAIAWCQQQGFAVDCVIPHLDAQTVQANDLVIGTLPIQMAARIQAQGARYLHLSLEVPFAWRGQELTSKQMAQADARLQELQINLVDADEPG